MATGLTCVETAERLVRNYATDPQTKKLLDNVEVFVLANVNPDGGHYSMYDFSQQRKNMTNYCPVTGSSDPAGRNGWGVDLNRNNTPVHAVRRLLRCLVELHQRDLRRPVGGLRAGDQERAMGRGHVPEHQVREQHPLLRWLLHVGAGLLHRGRPHRPLPAPNIGIEKYFFEAGEKILARIKEHRNTVILPERTGPIADVLYSAAGNSADEQWYRKGIITYSFETGADRITSTSTTRRDLALSSGRLPAVLRRARHRAAARGCAGHPVANRPLINEGRDEAIEFATGNFGLVESAYDYAMDTTPPRRRSSLGTDRAAAPPVNYRFNWDTRPRSSTTRSTARPRRCASQTWTFTRTSARAASGRC